MANETDQQQAPRPTGDRLVHELRNQLSIVVGFSEMLMNDLPPQSGQRADVDEILRAGKAALALTAHLDGRQR